MSGSGYEPLARYRDEFRDRFAELALEKFKDLARRSGVDVKANRATCAKVASLQASADSAGRKKSMFGCISAAGFLAAAVAAGALFLRVPERGKSSQSPWIAAIAAGIAAGVAAIPGFRSQARILDGLKRRIADEKSVAWRQMEPLNRLFSWDDTVKLIEATVPEIRFDPYFSAGALETMRSRFGWDDSFNDGKSVLFAQSGMADGSPFVFVHYLDMEWGTETYEGFKEISWTEWEEDEKGRRRPVRRYQTLRATVVKPKPEYTEQKLLVYCNAAAPGLSFSRQPSGLSGKDGDLWGAIKKRWRLGRLKAFSRNLEDESNFTLMSNHEFETWFHAKERDNEVEFRLMFTPVAQTQMLNLMKDAETGYGDDFAFVKAGMVNAIASKHLSDAVLDTDPARFRNWNYDTAGSFFISFSRKYFKDIYFSLAPLMSIPVYRQTRMPQDGGREPGDPGLPSFWEAEATANWHGDGEFKPARCITRCILKTETVEESAGESVVAVTAHGYEGIEHLDFVEVYGGDGNWHDVPVKWIEYSPVQRTRNMCMSVRASPSGMFGKCAAACGGAAVRRSIASFCAR